MGKACNSHDLIQRTLRIAIKLADFDSFGLNGICRQLFSSMNKILAILSVCLPVALVAAPSTSFAHDHGHRHHHKHNHKEEHWDGQCKVERKWKKNGEYKEKRKCNDRPGGYYAPQPVYVAPQPQGLVIDSRIVIRP